MSTPGLSTRRLLVATTNPGKLREYREMLSGVPGTQRPQIEWLTLADVGLASVDVEETGQTFWENALLKARTYCGLSGLPTLADDSGLAVDALDGGPGVYSARYAPTAEARNQKLLDALAGLPAAQRAARFVCVTALVTPDGLFLAGEGRVEGEIGTEPRGNGGFGYDPVFVLPDGRTMAELSAEEKNRISHRGRALAKLQPLLVCLWS